MRRNCYPRMDYTFIFFLQDCILLIPNLPAFSYQQWPLHLQQEYIVAGYHIPHDILYEQLGFAIRSDLFDDHISLRFHHHSGYNAIILFLPHDCFTYRSLKRVDMLFGPWEVVLLIYHSVPGKFVLASFFIIFYWSFFSNTFVTWQLYFKIGYKGT